MSSKQPKRNDPCPCGSGKLYKHCCKPSRRDRARQRKIARPAVPRPRSAARIQSRDPSSPADLRRMFDDLESQLPADRRQEFGDLFDLAEEIADFEEKQDEIEAAMQTLEEHRHEFEALAENPTQMMKRAHQVFSAEQFRPLRHTADEVRQAFEEVGYPANFGRPSEKDAEIIRSAILYLTDHDRRTTLTRKLLLRLPEYVAEGRYLDAWFIQHSAHEMVEAPEESNPFLFEMFLYGLGELEDRLRSERKAFLDRLGVDPGEIADLKPAELQSLMEEKLSSAEATAQAKAFFAANPLLHEQIQTQFRSWERDALSLLQRDDAQDLQLTPEETASWLPALGERLAPYEEQARRAEEQGLEVDPQVVEAMQQVFFEVAQEMAPTIFEPGRIDQLVARLKEYQYQLLAGGEKDAARSAYAAYAALESEQEPARNPFLIALCHVSLISAMIAHSEQILDGLEGEEAT